ncbi:MAG: YHS domain-containing protein [Pseudomonadota bacterium]|nr:YHS domain-containing protein [Patescibacteria group bacterium]
MAKDPVCGMEVKEGNVCSTYEGQKYCFCSQGCKDAFDKDSSRYTAKKGSTGQKHGCC